MPVNLTSFVLATVNAGYEAAMKPAIETEGCSRRSGIFGFCGAFLSACTYVIPLAIYGEGRFKNRGEETTLSRIVDLTGNVLALTGSGIASLSSYAYGQVTHERNFIDYTSKFLICKNGLCEDMAANYTAYNSQMKRDATAYFFTGLGLVAIGSMVRILSNACRRK